MENQRKIKIPKKYVSNVLLTFVTIFSMTICVYALVEGIVFRQNTFNFNHVVIIAFITFLLSNFIVLFFKINKITVFLQVAIVYSVLVIILFIMGFLLGWFSFKRFGFMFSAFLVATIGFFLFYFAKLIKNNYQMVKLNEDIASYKERVGK